MHFYLEKENKSKQFKDMFYLSAYEVIQLRVQEKLSLHYHRKKSVNQILSN